MVDARTGNVAELVTETAARTPGQLAFVDHATGAPPDLGAGPRRRRRVRRDAARGGPRARRPGGDRAAHEPRVLRGAVRRAARGRDRGPARPHSPAPELERILDDCGAAILVGEAAGSVPTVLDPPDLDAAADVTAERMLPPDGPRGGEDIAVLCYTSGTAGDAARRDAVAPRAAVQRRAVRRAQARPGHRDRPRAARGPALPRLRPRPRPAAGRRGRRDAPC